MPRDLTETEKLVKRTLAAKPFYRLEMGPALVRVLDQHCASDEHRRRVCDTAVLRRFGPEDRLEDRCPGPAELMELCQEIASAVPRGEAKPGCEYCHGDGFEQKGAGVERCRCGGGPMSDDSREEFLRREIAGRTPEERRQYSAWAAEFAESVRKAAEHAR